jgi:16S rRNA (adenine1518-N6/adenine1519-N6)-dimethyltransferase
VVKGILKKYGLAARKSLGQNFIIDRGQLEEIVAAAELGPKDAVLEVGPGIGTLTVELARLAGTVTAIELDKGFIDVLRETTSAFTNVTVISGDVLKINLDDVIEELLAVSRSSPPRVKVVANLPYYITTPVILSLLEQRRRLERMVFLVQEEVGERLIAPPGSREYGLLSVAAQYSCKVEILSQVPPSAFIPQPGVTSVIARLSVLGRQSAPATEDETLFFNIVRKAFGQRRKNLGNSLSEISGKEMARRALSTSGIDPLRRGETLSVSEFVRIAEAFRDLQ